MNDSFLSSDSRKESFTTFEHPAHEMQNSLPSGSAIVTQLCGP